MARPQKKGLVYFPFDTNFFSDRKIKILLGRYGADGITVYLYLLTEIYRENGYYLKKDDDFYYIMSADLNMSSDKIEQIIEFLCERSMFDKQLFASDDVLTARSIQTRFQEAVSERGKKTPIEVDGKIWLLEEKETESYIKYTQKNSFSPKNDSFSPKNDSFSQEKTSKVKKSKVNESKINKSRVEDEPLPDLKNENSHFDNLEVMGGKIGKGVIVLSEEQSEKLLEVMPIDIFNYYVEKLANFIVNKKAKVKNHYETILKWYNEDYK